MINFVWRPGDGMIKFAGFQEYPYPAAIEVALLATTTDLLERATERDLRNPGSVRLIDDQPRRQSTASERAAQPSYRFCEAGFGLGLVSNDGR